LNPDSPRPVALRPARSAVNVNSMSIMKLGFLASVTVLALVRCSPAEEAPTDSGPMALENTAWQLQSITVLGGFEFIPENPGDYVLRFRSDSRFSATSDCNRVSASWVQDGNNLDLEQFTTSNNMCPPGTLHNHFVSNLMSVQAFSENEQHLVFTTDRQGILLEFAPLAADSR